MALKLTPQEVRVLGCLIEKELTTPEYYPLSLNALTLACNQKTNREPVMQLQESEVTSALEHLREAGLAMRSAEGSRVARYAHNVTPKLSLDAEEVAVLCVLLLRGPQTAGEVRSRSERMRAFAEVSDVETVLDRLIEGDAPLVARLDRLPGRKENRYAHLLGAAAPGAASALPPAAWAEPLASPAADPEDDRVARLEDDVAALRGEVDSLKQELRDWKAQFE